MCLLTSVVCRHVAHTRPPIVCLSPANLYVDCTMGAKIQVCGFCSKVTCMNRGYICPAWWLMKWLTRTCGSTCSINVWSVFNCFPCLTDTSWPQGFCEAQCSMTSQHLNRSMRAISNALRPRCHYSKSRLLMCIVNAPISVGTALIQVHVLRS